MKLVSALSILAASCHAQTIETLIGELVNKIYRQEGTKHYFNVAPYFVAEYDFQPSSFEGKGTFGNGNGVITYDESASWDSASFTYEINQAGQAKSSPAADFYPAAVLEDNFESSLVISANTQGISYKQKGNINGEGFLAEYGLALDSFSRTSKKTSVSMSITRKNDVSANVHSFWRSYMAPNGETEINVKATVKNACMENPVGRQCTAKLEVTGENNGDDFGTNVAKYSVLPKKAQLIVKHNENQVFYLSLGGIDTWEVLSIKYKIMNDPSVLFLQVVGPSGAQAVVDAAGAFIAPFDRFFSGFSGADDFAHAFAYADKVLYNVQGKGWFDLYPIFEATRLESELFAGMFGVPSIQSAVEGFCDEMNAMIEGAAGAAAPAITDARTYVAGVVSSSGEAKFDAWFASL